ncbi:hypothetical protein [Chitinophaga nivalis]|uniref:Uncharacterized protein n=1 Tax=Chitinophaga nivalis TaxID=2991709 RepID=A0ABT3IK45_9BACT|nr:hypothetical protein [Chitinophaga nivalis]MCW3465972.1 hypothetical protein [Chitinophaga nivalis]MCW3484337.1 hypothetical protein [Chitinophaga nivalis]
MTKLKFTLAAVAAIMGLTTLSLAAGSKWSNITYRTVNGTPIPGSCLPVNPTKSQLEVFKQIHCMPDNTDICIVEYRDGRKMPDIIIKGHYIPCK